MTTPDGDDVQFTTEGAPPTHTVPNWQSMSEDDVTRIVSEEMLRGATTVTLMRERLTAKLTSDGFSKWSALIKQLIDQYGGQVQQLLRRIAEQDTELQALALVQTDNDKRLSRLAQLASTVAERLKGVLESTTTWSTPPRTYAVARGIEPPPDAAAAAALIATAEQARIGTSGTHVKSRGEKTSFDGPPLGESEGDDMAHIDRHGAPRDRLNTVLEEETTLGEEAEC